MRKYLIWVVGFLFVCTTYYIFSHRDLSQKRDPFYHIKITDRYFCIPKKYFGTPPMDPEGFLIGAMLPDLHPVNKAAGEDWVGVSYVSVMASPIRDYKLFQDVYIGTKKNAEADRDMGVRDGLRHYTQPEDVRNADADDVYVDLDDRGKAKSFITCGKSLTPGDHPECIDYLIDKEVFYQIEYRSVNLNSWKEIRNKAISLSDHYDCTQQKLEPLNKEK